MKKTLLFFVLCVLLVTALGCGKEGTRTMSKEEAVSLIESSVRAMSQLKGYRMKGSVEMNAAGGDAGSGTLEMDLESEVENVGDTAYQHMRMTMGNLSTEAYIYQGYFYQNIPGSGWTKMGLAEYQAQNLSTGLVNTEQLRQTVEAMEEATLIGEDEESKIISLRLGKEFLLSSLDAYREAASEEELARMEQWLGVVESVAEGFTAEMRLWIGKKDNLIRRMETVIELKDVPQLGDYRSTMSMDVYDYDADIHIELPAEAEQAREMDTSASQ